MGAEPKPKREPRQVRYQRKIERLNAKSAELEAKRAELEAELREKATTAIRASEGLTVSRPYADQEIRIMIEAIEQASGKKLSKKRATDLALDLAGLLSETAHLLENCSVSPRERTRRVNNALRATKRLQGALAGLQEKNYLSLRASGIAHVLGNYSAEDLRSKMAEGEAWLAWFDWLATCTVTANEIHGKHFNAYDLNRPTDQILSDRIAAYMQWWRGHSDAWRDSHAGSYRGNFWTFVRTALAPISERIGVKGGDGALFSRVERMCRKSNNSATAEKE
jgi:hypothetical protein